MVGPTNLKPRAASSLDIARDSAVSAGTCFVLRKRLTLRLAVEEIPQQRGEARAFLHHLEPGARREHRALDLQPVAHDAGIVHQRSLLARVVARNFGRLEVVEGAAEVVALAQDGDPRQAGLEAVEHELLVERAVVVLRHAPFLVVIGDVERVVLARPGAAVNAVGMEKRRGHSAAFSPGHANVAQPGLRGAIRTPPAISGVPAAIASATRSSRSIASALGPAAEPMVPTCRSPAVTGTPTSRCMFLDRDRYDAVARGAAMLHARHHLLADVAALVEIDAGKLVHVGFVREGVTVDEIEPAARHAERDAMGLVGGRIDEFGTEVGGGLLRQMRRQHHPQAKLRQSRIGIDQAVFGVRRAVPHRQHAQHLRQILGDHLGAQLVEIEPLHQRTRQRARTVEEEAAAVGGRRLGYDAIDDDLALRGEQRAKARLPGSNLGDVGRQQAVQEAARVLAGDLDDTAVGEKCRFHAIAVASGLRGT